MHRPSSGFVRQQLEQSIAVKQQLLGDSGLIAQVEAVAGLVVDSYRNGGKVLLAGNGGSAADAQHIAAELVCRFEFDRPAVAAIALTTDTSIMTAVSNDYGYDSLFSRQVEAYGRPGDVFVGISTSGNSANVLQALAAARGLGLTTVGLTGAGGGRMVDLCDHCLQMPSDDTPRIQECHITIGHILCAHTERSLFGD